MLRKGLRSWCPGQGVTLPSVGMPMSGMHYNCIHLSLVVLFDARDARFKDSDDLHLTCLVAAESGASQPPIWDPDRHSPHPPLPHCSCHLLAHISAAAPSRGPLGVPSRLCGRLPRSPPRRVPLPSLLLPLALPTCSLLLGPVPVCRALPCQPWAPNHGCRRSSCRPSGRAPPPPRSATGSPSAMAPVSGQRCPHRRPAGALHRGRP